jgi:hypothetical protein
VGVVVVQAEGESEVSNRTRVFAKICRGGRSSSSMVTHLGGAR